MHRCLEIPELLNEVVAYLDQPDPVKRVVEYSWLDAGADGRRELAALARTCKSFTEPALDVL